MALGSYSYAKPGFADERAVLAAPHDNRLFFAGEACSRAHYSTAHGAFETGVRAAEEALAGLEPSPARVADNRRTHEVIEIDAVEMRRVLGPGEPSSICTVISGLLPLERRRRVSACSASFSTHSDSAADF